MSEIRHLSNPQKRAPWYSSMAGRMAIAFCSLSMLVLLTINLSELYGLPFGILNGDVADITRQELTLLSKIADANKRLLSNWLTERRSDVFAVAKSPYLADLARSRRSTAQKPALADWLKVVRSAYLYETVSIIDPVSGKTIVGSSGNGKYPPLHPSTLADARRQGVEETVVFTPEPSTRSAHLQIIRQVGQELTSDESPVLLLVFTLDLDAVLKPMLDSAVVGTLGRSGEVIIVDKNKRFLTSTRYPLADGAVVVPLNSIDKGKPSQLAAEGAEGTIRATDYRGVQVLAAYRHIPMNAEIALGMVVKIDSAEALAPIQKQKERLILFLLAGVTFTMICSIVIARQMGRPLHRVAEIAAIIEAGDLTQRVPLEGTIETIDLGRSFNSMVERLEASHDELEQRVLDRTSQLEILNRKLSSEIDERKQAENEIQRLNRELEQRVVDRTAQLEAANKELEAFCYSVSHDLRAPLRHIDGYVELLVSRCRDGLSEKGLHYVDIIAASARQMGTLIDDLLQFSRTGRAEMHRENIDMNRALKEVRAMLQEDSDGRQIEWVVNDLPPVRGDYPLLRQVWANLLGNAVKYTRSREVARIEVRAHEDNGEIIFVVEDNGVGFDMQYVNKLFGVFQRLHTQEEFEGTGIGLATVQRIINRHGGRVWAEGELNRGARFYFTLPK